MDSGVIFFPAKRGLSIDGLKPDIIILHIIFIKVNTFYQKLIHLRF